MSTRTPIWFISGAFSGLGRVVAEAVLERGRRAVVMARNLASLHNLVARHGERALPPRLDVTAPLPSTAPSLRPRLGSAESTCW